jgi:hypothetical protein
MELNYGLTEKVLIQKLYKSSRLDTEHVMQCTLYPLQNKIAVNMGPAGLSEPVRQSSGMWQRTEGER